VLKSGGMGESASPCGYSPGCVCGIPRGRGRCQSAGYWWWTPQGKPASLAFFSTDLTLTSQTLVEWFVLRWNVEVTFEEGRRHLGLETQRQCSDKAIARTTPVLLGLFSLVCLMAHRLLDVIKLPLQATAWYLKQDATFSDALAFVRRAIWAGKYLDNSSSHPDQIIFHRTEWKILLDQLASTG
jgi:hypothetical protein